MGNQGSLMIIPRGKVMVPGFHVMKFDVNQDGLQVRGQVILDITSRSEERVDCNLCDVTNMDVETYEVHKKTQFHMENLGAHLLCHEEEEGFVTPMEIYPPRTPPAPTRRLRDTEEVSDYRVVNLNNTIREIDVDEDDTPFSLSQELDDVPVPTEMIEPVPVPTEITGPIVEMSIDGHVIRCTEITGPIVEMSIDGHVIRCIEPPTEITGPIVEMSIDGHVIELEQPTEMITNLRLAFVTDLFKTIRAQGNFCQNRKIFKRAIETWHQHLSKYLVIENKKKLAFLVTSVLREYRKYFKDNKIDIIQNALNEDPDAETELFIVDDDDDTIIDDDTNDEAITDVADPIIQAIVADPVVVADPIIPDVIVTDTVVPDVVVADTEVIVAGTIIPEYEEEEVKEGYHEYNYPDGCHYKGNYVNNERSGYGVCIFVYEDDGIYKGHWFDDRRNGQGVMEFYNGDVYEGEWKNNHEDGKGKLIYKKGESYEGDYKDGWRHGQGFYRYKTHKRIKGDQMVSYEGEWKNNKQDGFGKLTWSDGTVEEGFWVADKKSNKRKAPISLEIVTLTWKIINIKGDGNCTFRALAYLIYGNECYYLLLRRVCYETIFAEGNQHLLEDEERVNWAKFGNEGGPVAIETIARLYGCQVNVIDSRKRSMSGNGPYNENAGNPVLTLVYSPGHYDVYSNGVFDFKSDVFSAKDRETIGSFENRILQAKGGQINSDQVPLVGSLQYNNREYNILDVVYARLNWMTLPPKTLLDLHDGLIQHTFDEDATKFKYFDNVNGYDTKKKPQQAHQYLYYYKIGKDKWICGLLATISEQQEVQYIKRVRKT